MPQVGLDLNLAAELLFNFILYKLLFIHNLERTNVASFAITHAVNPAKLALAKLLANLKVVKAKDTRGARAAGTSNFDPEQRVGPAH